MADRESEFPFQDHFSEETPVSSKKELPRDEDEIPRAGTKTGRQAAKAFRISSCYAPIQ